MNGSESDAEHLEIDRLFPVVYEELKRLARHHRRDAGLRSTLCTTELVHEAFFKLAGPDRSSWEGRAHFFGAASRAMRQVLVDFARKRSAVKRGGDPEMVSLSQADTALELELDELLELDSALDRLDALEPRLRRIVELRFFCGLADHEIAPMLGVSTRTVGRDWLKAKLFLLGELQPATERTREYLSPRVSGRGDV
jgi:RNA polymerase sigma factor (TIGR02999 family)